MVGGSAAARTWIELMDTLHRTLAEAFDVEYATE